jgi:D-alanyl-lipoteichoic acid acyltransferase DltB (MBOAT superfamily)
MPITIALRNYGKSAIFIGLFITFFLSGLWHGPSWHYILFGVLHGIALIFEIRTAKSRKKLYKKIPVPIVNFFGRLFTFAYVLFTWVFFRAASAHDGANYIKDMFTRPFFVRPEYKMYIQYAELPFLFAFLYLVDWINRDANNISPFFDKIKFRPMRYSFYLLLVLFILLFGTFNKTAFIYFQF